MIARNLRNANIKFFHQLRVDIIQIKINVIECTTSQHTYVHIVLYITMVEIH